MRARWGWLGGLLVLGTCGLGAPAKDDGTYVCKLDGSGRLRVAGPTVACWYPSGRQLLLAPSNAIYRVNADGTDKVLLYRDSGLEKVLGLCLSASGKYCAASVVRKDAVGEVRVWSLSDGKQLVCDPLYKNAAPEKGQRYIVAQLAWSARADLLAWAPMQYEGLSKRANSVKVFDGESARWATWYLDKVTVEALGWQPDRGTLLVGAGPTIHEISDDGRTCNKLVASVTGGGAGDSPLCWLPKADALYWGQGFYGLAGQVLSPELPDGEGPLARLCWTSPDGRNLVLAVSKVTPDGQCASDLLQGQLGSPFNTFKRLCTLPTVPQLIQLTPDGSRVAYVVGGYVPD